ncbi:MAG: hypothetical protein NW216_11635 [Hyphomicrobium sp.]|nr:hypothetical protein [Hyphomicrobium sp.]
MSTHPSPPEFVRKLIPLLALPLVASAAGMAYAAAERSRPLGIVAAAGFAVVLLFVAYLVNRPWGVAASAEDARLELFHTQRRNTRLAMLVYAWGAAALIATYGIAGLVWQHGLQYAAGSAVIACLLLLYVRKLGVTGEPPPLYLTLLHAAAVTGGLIFLSGTGKLGTLKGDWAANYVFLFGGLSILGLCFIATITHWRLNRAGAHRGGAPVQR